MKSKKYLEYRSNKIKLNENTLAAAALSGVAGSAVMASIPLAAQGIGNVMSKISQSIAKFKYDTFGCKKIVDQDERDRCEARQIDILLSELRNGLGACSKAKDVNACKERINSKIEEYRQKRQKLLYGG